MNILIFKNKNDLRPVGGPSGYIYNLKTGLDNLSFENCSISYLDLPPSTGQKRLSIIKKLPKWFSTFLIRVYTIKKYKKILKSPGQFDFTKYDIVHFHSTIDMYYYRKALEKYKGVVLLNSHCPKAQHKEIIEDYISKKTYNKNKKFFDKLEIIDEYSFNRADYIIFPCLEALEPYFASWPKFREIYELKKESFLYLITGIKKVIASKPKDYIRKKYNIPLNAKLICFAGRHNSTKGYDLLINLHKLCPEYYFLIAGSNEGVDYPKDSHWIEVGWTNDPYSIISAADVFILPNKQTYFDLILLEVLSLGVPCIISRTGGNKYFERFRSKGIGFFDTLDDLVINLKKFFKNDSSFYENANKENKQIFDKNFTNEIFAMNYINILKQIYE